MYDITYVSGNKLFKLLQVYELRRRRAGEENYKLTIDDFIERFRHRGITNRIEKIEIFSDILSRYSHSPLYDNTQIKKKLRNLGAK